MTTTEPGSRYAVCNDRYDREDFVQLLHEYTEFAASREKLVALPEVGDQGYDIFQDLYLGLWKAWVENHEEPEMRAERMINWRVNQEAQTLPERNDLRIYTQSDEVGAALGVTKLEPAVERIYQRLEKEQDLQQQLMDLCEQLAKAIAERIQAYQALQVWQEANPKPEEPEDAPEGEPEEGEGAEGDEGEGEQEGDGEGQALEAAYTDADGNVQSLEEQVAEAQAKLDAALDEAGPEIRGMLREGMKQARDEARGMENMSQLWGSEPGALKKMPLEQRLELAKFWASDKVKKAANMIGAMQRLAFGEQRKKVDKMPLEHYGVELGGDLSRVLGSEFAKLVDEDREWLFYADFLDRKLPQYKIRGNQMLAKGGIYYCFDGSGSMAGDPEIWAKVVGITLLKIAAMQRREFFGLQFSYRNDHHEYDFREATKKGKDIAPEDIVAFIQDFIDGGTDFMSPIDRCIELLEEEFEAEGAVKGDIVFATDGQCRVTPEWLEELAETKERLGVTIWGIVLGHDRTDMEPLATICDGRVATIDSLTTGEDIREIFGGV